MRLFAPTLALAFALLLAGAAYQEWPHAAEETWWRVRPPDAETIFARRLQPALARTCYECHDAATAEGQLALDRFPTLEAMRAHRDTWERVLTNVRYGLMPPADEPQPTPAERAQLVTWLEQTLHPLDPARPDPGRIVVRRLNREEYRHTVRDLLGVTFDPAADFPEDDSGYGFDHIGSVLSVSPLLLERYLAAARTIADAVIVEPRPLPQTVTARGRDLRGGREGRRGARSLLGPGRLAWDVEAPATGRYRLTVDVYEDRAGDEPARFAVLHGDQRMAEFTADGTERAPASRRLEVKLLRGRTTLDFEFLNDLYRPATDGQPQLDRNFHLLSVALEGPFDPEPLPLHALHRRLLGRPAAGESEDAWIARTLRTFATRAFRRPATADEVARLAALVHQATTAGDDVEVGFKLALQAILASPSFLFRGEAPAPDERADQTYPVSDYALATRLSYFLWSSTPDDALLALASAGSLRPSLHQQLERLLADPRAARFVTNFTGQWLLTRNLTHRETDPKLFPAWGPELAASMQEETLRFVGDFLTNGLPIHRLLDADWTFADARLAALYAADGGNAQRSTFNAQRSLPATTSPTTPPGAPIPTHRAPLSTDSASGAQLSTEAREGQQLHTRNSQPDGADASFTTVAPSGSQLSTPNSQLSAAASASTAAPSASGSQLWALDSQPAKGASAFVRLALPPERRGLLTQPAILAASSYPNRTSPVLRGKFVLDKILGTPPPPPPPNIPSLDSADAHGGAAPLTLRARLEAHRASPSCASCHALIDPVGFALENFDALGAWRTTDAGQPIDATGRLVTGEQLSSATDLAAVLAGPKRAEFHRHFAATLLTYALGRGLDYYDAPAIDRIVAQAATQNHTFPAYLHAVIDSLPFTHRRGEPLPPTRLAATGPRE